MSLAIPAGARPSLLAPLRARDFRLLWAGTILSLLGDGLGAIALTWMTLQLTGSPLATGGVLAAGAIPRGVLGLPGGAVADRFGPRRVGAVTTAVRALGMAMLGCLALQGTVHVAEIYAVSVLFGAADAFYGPSRASLLPRSVPPEQLEAANGLEGGASSLLQLIAPAAGGVLVARLGAGYALAADAVLLAGVIALTLQLRVGVAERDGERPSLWRDVQAGLRYTFGDPVLRTLIVLITAMTFAISGPEAVGFATLARTRWGGATALGLALGAFGAGALGGSLLAGVLPPGRILRKLVGVAVAFSIGLPLIGLAPNLLVAMALIAALGITSGVINVLGSTWFMRRTDAALLGRVISVMMVTEVAAGPLSLAAAGAVAQVDVRLLFFAAGALMLVAALGSLTSRTVREAE